MIRYRDEFRQELMLNIYPDWGDRKVVLDVHDGTEQN